MISAGFMAELMLEIVEGEGAGEQLPLTGDLELGRDPGLAHPIADEQVSRRHARVGPSQGGAVVEDLGSTNGTYVNDQPLEGRRELAPGDRIRIGLTVLELRAQGQASRTAVVSSPAVTKLGADVLRPAALRELAPIREDIASLPGLLTEEAEPAFIRESVVRPAVGEDEVAAEGSDYDALAKLVDTRVKRQTGIAAIAVLAISALAVAIFFGVR